MSWELISSIMVITLPADYLAAMALPQGFPWVLQQLIFSVAGAPELEQHGRQLPRNRLQEGRETERGRGKKKSHVRDPLPLPSQATSLWRCLLLSRFVPPGCAFPWPHGALCSLRGSIPLRCVGLLPSRVVGWVGYLGRLPQRNIASLASHTAHFRAPTAATLRPGAISVL